MIQFSITLMFLQFVHACGMVTYAEVLAANFESGTWIICDSKLCTSNAIRILGDLYPRQPVDPDASMERDTWMDQNKEAVAQRVSTIDTDHVKSKNQDMEDFPDYQKPLIFLNLSRVTTSTNAQNVQVELSLLCAGGVHEPDP